MEPYLFLLLCLAVLVLAVFLIDTRSRLSRLERGLREWREAVGYGDAAVTGAAVGMAPPVSEPHTTTATQDAAPGADSIAEDMPAEMPVIAPDAEVTVTPVSVSATFPAQEPVLAQSDDTALHVEPARAAKSGISFEDLFGRKLPIWAGGVTLLVAAVLLVKYSIDAGLISPAIRVVMGLVFSALLIGAAEIARRKPDLVQDDRIAQALAGAAIGGLYAAILAAANLYGLIGSGLAFAGLSLVTALAIGLSLRFGMPTAVLGLVGGLATPALVQSEAPSLPLLSGYLAIVLGALTLLSRRQRWTWLGLTALTGGGLWTLYLVMTGIVGIPALLSVGLLILFLGIALPHAIAEDGLLAETTRGLAASVAALQLAGMVAMGGFSMLTWGLYGLLSVAFIWVTEQTPRLRPTIFLPLIIALALLFAWDQPTVLESAVVIAGIVVTYGGSALWRLWREDGGVAEAVQIALVAIFCSFAAVLHHWAGKPSVSGVPFAWLSVGFALLPFAGVALGLRRPERVSGWRFPLLAMAGGFLLIYAAMLGLEGWAWPIICAAVATGLLALGYLARVPRLTAAAAVYLLFGLLVLVLTGNGEGEITRLAADMSQAEPLQAILRWLAVAGAAVAFAVLSLHRRLALMMQGVAAALGYGLIAQILPYIWLPAVTALALLGLAEWARRQPAHNLFPGIGVLGTIVAAWMLPLMAQWAVAGAASLVGIPMLVSTLPTLDQSLLQLLIPAAIGGIVTWRILSLIPSRLAPPVFGFAGLALLVALHILYKQLFHIATPEAFVAYGLAERSLWQAVLLAAGFGLWRFGQHHWAGFAAVSISLLHNLVYSWGLHNPLWSEQAVGAWPLVNLLLPALALPLLAVWLLPQIWSERADLLARLGDGVAMVVIALFAFTSLRHAFAGSVMAWQPIGAGESIGWSIVTILLGIGYLVWGIRRRQRDWRIASLLLMLVAVGKVFLLDAAGLEGLLRIVSFLALGFSLIGIGWLYSRFLRPDETVG